MRLSTLGLLGLALCGACSDTEPKRVSAGSPGTGAEGDGDGDDGNGGQSGLPPDFAECASSTVKAGLGRAGNIVWVIDTSGSMDEEAALVQDNMNRFVEAIAEAGLEDYRVVVVSERDFVDVPDPLGSDREHFLFLEEEVSSNEPLEDLLSRFDDFQGFLLEGAVTHYVVVTDDESDIAASEFISQMTRELGGGDFRVHAIASPPGATPAPPEEDEDSWEDWFGGGDDDDSGCSGSYGSAAAPGVEHYRAAELTKGLTFSICEADWSGLFSELATEVGNSATIPCDLAIPTAEDGLIVDPRLINLVLTDADSSEGEVLRKNDSCSGAGWTYDNADNPTRIKLCPTTCSAAGGSAVLEIAVGCETEIL
jgi:hypothetical protein